MWKSPVNRFSCIPGSRPDQRLRLILWVWMLVMATGLNAQPLSDTLSLPWKTLATPKTGMDVECDEEGNFFVLDRRNNRLYKYYALYGYDSVQSIGGKGMSGEGLNQPVRIRSGNRQALYCLDAGNRRLLVLNTNLRVVREINYLVSGASESQSDGNVQIWPLSFAVGPAGDFFLLNQEDNRVLKYDATGKFQLAFGGLDFGQGSLHDPADIHMSEDNLIYITDTIRQQVKVFDLFGVYRYTLYPPAEMHFREIRILERNLIWYNGEEIQVEHLDTKKVFRLRSDTRGNPIRALALNRLSLGILTSQELLLFR